MTVIIPKNCVTMKYVLLMLHTLLIVNAAPFLNQPFAHQPMMAAQMMLVPIDPVTVNHQQMDQMMMRQPMMNQAMMDQIMKEQLMEQMIQQNQHNALQEQLIALQQLQAQQLNAVKGPTMLRQPIIMLLPNTMTKSNDRIENTNGNNQPNLKLTNDDTESVVIDAENEQSDPEINFPRQAILVLPNGQRLFIGSIISAIPFLPFEVNVPDTIAWMYNGIAGIIGGIGQRLPFRPRPTTESPDLMQTQESTAAAPESRFKLLQKLIKRQPNVGMPIIMLPAVQAVPVTVTI